VHEEQGWLAVADIHYGFELNRARKLGAIAPEWGMAATEKRLMALLRHYKPRTLILNGDVMDGGGSIREAERFIGRVRDCVAELVLVAGNHDRPVLKREQQFVSHHAVGDLVFHHGHKFAKMLHELAEHPAQIHVCGHEHPALPQSERADKRAKLPVLVQDRLKHAPKLQHWILPAFSPWTGGARYESANERLATWSCGEDGHIHLTSPDPACHRQP
jgi:metallophosphoesterase superfamily enzyme